MVIPFQRKNNMNQFKGKIQNIKAHNGIVLVELHALNGIQLTSVIIESADTAKFIRLENEVKVLFKETEVMIGKGDVSTLSVRNKIPCTIVSLQSGEILSQIDLETEKTKIKSIITTNACKQLHLKTGDKVFALIKSNEISLSEND